MTDVDEWIEPEGGRPTRLTRDPNDRIIGGVCAGIARYYGWSPFRVRVIYVAVSVLSAAFPGILTYIALWLLIPPGRRA